MTSESAGGGGCAEAAHTSPQVLELAHAPTSSPLRRTNGGSRPIPRERALQCANWLIPTGRAAYASGDARVRTTEAVIGMLGALLNAEGDPGLLAYHLLSDTMYQ